MYWGAQTGGWGFNGLVRLQGPVVPFSTTVPAWPDEPRQIAGPNPNGVQVGRAGQPFIFQSRPRRATPEEIQNSMVWQAKADEFRISGRYAEALDAYRKSIEIAPDQPEPYFKSAILLGEAGQYREAVHQLRGGMDRDATWLHRAETLTNFFGGDHPEIVRKLLQSTAQWARGDIRDPERLLLVGTFLVLEGEYQPAEIPLRSAQNLLPDDPHIQAVMSYLNLRLQSKPTGIQQTGGQVPSSPSGGFPRPSAPVGGADPALEISPQPVPKRKSGTSSVPAEETPPEPMPSESSGATEETQPSGDSGADESPESDESGPLFPDALN